VIVVRLLLFVDYSWNLPLRSEIKIRLYKKNCVDNAAEFFKIQKLYENSPTSKKTYSLRVLTNSSELLVEI